MSKPFEAFYNNWCSYQYITHNGLPWLEYTANLDRNFFAGLEFVQPKLTFYRQQAAHQAAEMLGQNPALCLSGGIDSQSMVYCWKQAGLKFDVVSLVFNNGLNQQDVNSARKFCQQENLNLVEIPLDIVAFLTRDCYELATKYQCRSPHFATHYKLFDMLRERGYTGVCAGGEFPTINNGQWSMAMTTNQLNFVNYVAASGYPAVGNFLCFSPELAWTLAILSPDLLLADNLPEDMAVTYKSRSLPTSQALDFMAAVRYQSKIQAMHRHGIPVIPQTQKYTGFELVKQYFANQTGDGWAFENQFRVPLERMFTGTFDTILHLDPAAKQQLDSLHNANTIKPN